MNRISQLDSIPEACRGGVVSVGNFDGVHRGHAALIRTLRDLADRIEGPAVVLTFDPHPLAVLRPEAAPEPLSWPERKAELLGRLGVDHVVLCRTDRSILGLTAEAFFEQVVRGRLAARGMVEGPNFFFGKDRGGDIHLLEQLCRAAEMPLVVAEPTASAGGLISSTRIRQLIRAGDVRAASRMLTAAHRIVGRVVRGDGRGRRLGFATANLAEIPVLVPGPGVYATRAEVAGRPYAAATHVGPNPTFGQNAAKVEVHLLDFDADLYGATVAVDFVDRVRDITRFDSPDALSAQLREDVAEVRRRLAGASKM